VATARAQRIANRPLPAASPANARARALAIAAVPPTDAFAGPLGAGAPDR
jgi:hypothetical protein